MNRPSVLFVCSTVTQVETFAPVAAELAVGGIECAFASLDVFYGLGSSRAIDDHGLHAIGDLGQGDGVGQGFYLRPAPVVLIDVMRARVRLKAMLDRIEPRVVVLGNDFGLVEKAIVDLARARSARTVLIQDGTISAKRPAGSRLGRARRRLRHGLSVGIGRSSVWYLGASEYGQGRVDAIAASGPESASIFVSRGVESSRVVITGQPRYDGLIGLAAARQGPRWQLLYATTPYERAGLGQEPQTVQDELIRQFAARLKGSPITFVVKPHPREDPGRYSRLVQGSDAIVAAGRIRDHLLDSRVLVTGPSTAVEEATILGVPVIVAAPPPIEVWFEPSLPPQETFPRFGSLEVGMAMIDGLRSESAARALSTSQRAAVSKRIFFDDTPAAARVAAVIRRELAGASAP